MQAYQGEEGNDEEDMPGGVILAHSMGLGKSLQTIAFLHTFHAYWPGNRSLLLVPSNVLHNWVDEFHRWLPRGRDEAENELTPSKVCTHCSTTGRPSLASSLFACDVSSLCRMTEGRNSSRALRGPGFKPWTSEFLLLSFTNHCLLWFGEQCQGRTLSSLPALQYMQ